MSDNQDAGSQHQQNLYGLTNVLNMEMPASRHSLAKPKKTPQVFDFGKQLEEMKEHKQQSKPTLQALEEPLSASLPSKKNSKAKKPKKKGKKKSKAAAAANKDPEPET